FSVYAGGGFFKIQGHVVAEIGTAARATTTAATAASAGEKILEAEEVAKNIVEVLENGAAEIDSTTRAGKASMAVGVIDLALFGIAEDAVGLRAFTKFPFRFGFVFWMAVRMPFDSALAVGRLDFLDSGGTRDA